MLNIQHQVLSLLIYLYLSQRRNTHALLGVVFFIVALLAGVLGFFGIAGIAASIAKILFIIFLVLFVVALITGRRRL
ncbi:MAG: DUF1328 domain-containing protein [Acidithiobacillus ferrivorans]